MLLVDNSQPHLRNLNSFLNERVGADDQLDLAAADAV